MPKYLHPGVYVTELDISQPSTLKIAPLVTGLLSQQPERTSNMNIFLPSLTPEQLAILKSNEIVYCKDRVDNMIGVIINEDRIEDVRRLLTITSSELVPHERIEELSILLINTEPPDSVETTKKKTGGKVEIRQWNGELKQSLIVECLKELSRTTKKTIEWWAPHSNPHPLPGSTSKKFFVFMWSTCDDDGEAGTSTPRAIYGHAVGCSDASYDATGKGIPIMDGEYCVAELFHNALYIHHDLTHRGGHSVVQLTKELIKRTIQAYERFFSDTTKKETSFGIFPVGLDIGDDIKKSITRYLSVFNKNVVVTANTSSKITDRFIKINFKSIDSDPLKVKTLCGSDKVSGLEIHKSEPMYYQIIDEDSKKIIANVDDNNINILVTPLQSTDRLDVFDFILQKSTDFIGKSLDEKIALVESQQELLDQLKFEEYMKLVTVLHDARKKESKQNIQKYQDEIVAHQNNLVTSIRSLNDEMNFQSHLRHNLEEYQSVVTREFNTLKKNKNLVGFKMENNKIIAITKNIYCKDPSNDIIYDIGNIKITMSLCTKSDIPLIHFENLKYSKKRAGPHVFETGLPCLGNIQTALPELISKGNFAIAIELAIQFLSSVNKSDMLGGKIGEFVVFYNPQKDKEMPKKNDESDPDYLKIFESVSFLDELKKQKMKTVTKKKSPSKKKKMLDEKVIERIIEIDEETIESVDEVENDFGESV